MKRMTGYPIRSAALVSSLFFWLLPAIAQADVTISAHATAHMNCTGGVCTPTAAKAVLNVSDLNVMLASGAVTVKSSAVAALTRSQLQEAMPAGFDPSIWGQSPSVNHGYPYLLNNPPR